jgi:glycosyltransferase involved in cell wall biosynthesis
MFKPCVVIPVYNHEHAVGILIKAVIAMETHCILVDDGSSPACAHLLDELAAGAPGAITLLRHAVNRGKGAAVLTGMRHGVTAGYSHALQIDADGQHCAADIPRFLAQAEASPLALIIGCPKYDETVPKTRLYARYLTHVWVWINTLSLQIKDSMCGFRVYPLPPLLALAGRRQLGGRMDFDTEVLVRLYWEGLQVVNLSTAVVYPADGVSHFRIWRDNALISRMHATLFCGMLLRLPMLLSRKWRAE